MATPTTKIQYLTTVLHAGPNQPLNHRPRALRKLPPDPPAVNRSKRIVIARSITRRVCQPKLRHGLLRTRHPTSVANFSPAVALRPRPPIPGAEVALASAPAV